MKGRKPEPTALRILRGNPSKGPVNRAEPTHPALAGSVPAELTDPIARQEWERIAPTLIESGHVTTPDRALLIGYCIKWAQWLALERLAAQKPIPNHPFCAANNLFALLLKTAAELGMTPSARSRVIAQTPKPVATPAGRWAGLLK